MVRSGVAGSVFDAFFIVTRSPAVDMIRFLDYKALTEI